MAPPIPPTQHDSILLRTRPQNEQDGQPPSFADIGGAVTSPGPDSLIEAARRDSIPDVTPLGCIVNTIPIFPT